MDSIISDLVEVVGWIGSIEVILAYALVSNGKIKSDSSAFQWLNLTGGIFLMVNTVVHRAYPSSFINLVWIIIAVVALWNIRKQKNKRPLAREVD